MVKLFKLNVFNLYYLIPFAKRETGYLFGSDSCNYSKNISSDNISDKFVPIITPTEVIDLDS